MEDHYDKVLEHVASAHSTYSKALTELLSGIDRVVAVAEQKDATATTNPDAARKTLKQLKSLLDEIIDRSEKHEEEKLLKKSKAARGTLEVLRQRLRSSNGKMSQQKETAATTSKAANSLGSSVRSVSSMSGVDEAKSSREDRKEGKKKKAIALSVLSMQSLEELISLAKRCSDKTENLINILKRLKKTQVSAEKLKQTGAGVYIAGLKKHENPQIAALAKSVVTVWKESVKAASKKESKKESGKLLSKQAKEVSKFAKMNSKEVRKQQEEERKRRANTQEPVRPKKKKRRQVEVETQPLSQEEWERQYLNRARQGYDKYQEEENYSAYVGKQDDLRSMREDGY